MHAGGTEGSSYRPQPDNKEQYGSKKGSYWEEKAPDREQSIRKPHERGESQAENNSQPASGMFNLIQRIYVLPFKELQFKARVSRPDPRFARLLSNNSAGGNAAS